ncbi:MAG TPA: 3-hydroxyacyl-CoA dehydrogenase NAD-binding domain-containing protein [Cyclobacteriaceae bacterium]
MDIDQIKKIVVVGAGTMGQGIAQACAQANYEVTLYDINKSAVDQARSVIEKNLNTAIDKGKLKEEDKVRILSKIHLADQITSLQCDLVIEAVVEKLEVKQDLFNQLEEINSGKAILATNTSSLSVTQIAASLKNPSNCIGLHFFNPAYLMKLVEVVYTFSTSPRLINRLKDFSISLGKIPVVAKDSPGFIVNRVARHFYVESLKLLEENNSSVVTIDELLKSTGFKMGPFELMDLIGIDINLAVTTSVYEGFNEDPKFRPSLIQQEKVAAGHLGRKTGKGFYDYSKG